jgi:hypothetical protein
MRELLWPLGQAVLFLLKRVKPKLLKADIYNIGINEWEV